MSAEHYWPTEPGEYKLERYRIGGPTYTYRFDGSRWTYSDDTEASCETDDLIRDYYLGVRREQVAEPCVDDTSDKYADAELHADAFNWRHAKEHGIAVTFDGDVIGKATYWEDSGDSSVGIPATGGWELTGSNIGELSNKASRGDDLDALIREAIAEFRRDVKQPTKAADWAFKWANRFIEAVGS